MPNVFCYNYFSFENSKVSISLKRAMDEMLQNILGNESDGSEDSGPNEIQQ